ncbi:Ig-like domain-containing protein, partial [candidate division KSB1 bacterium]|nr:Ig-like domain-containing protein [candidate division KSB1 bacterium]
MQKICFLFVGILIFLILATCANQGFPPGGPVDKTPPSVVHTYPEHSAVRVPLQTRIELTFNERVDRKSCIESIFITPFPAQGLKSSWRGKKLRLEVREGLLDDRTYVVTVGAGTRDYRNNPMAESFTLAFSTGGHLDSGELGGTVYSDGRTEGTQLWAYDLIETPEPDPSRDKPIYITQAGRDGGYSFTHLALRPYRVFAVFDRYADGLYDPETDVLGVPHRDVRLDSSRMGYPHLNFFTARRDTTRPTLTSASASNAFYVDLRFSEPLKPEGLDQTDNYRVSVADSLVPLRLAYANPRNPAFVHLVLEKPLEKKTYGVTVFDATDRAGLSIDPEGSSVEFVGRALADTVGPRVVQVQPPDSARSVNLDRSVHILFSEPLDTTAVEKNLVLSDSCGKKISGRLNWPSPVSLVFHPDSLLARHSIYRFTAPVDSIVDLYGNALQDTLFDYLFYTVNPDTFSLISGTIVDEEP